MSLPLLSVSPPSSNTGNKKMELHLINYLKGTWNIQGRWRVQESDDSVVDATMSGEEHYDYILDKQFLEKRFNGKITYTSPKDNSLQEIQLSALTLFAFNKQLKRFNYWYFDCFGETMAAKGIFDNDAGVFKFQSSTTNAQGILVETEFVLNPISPDRFEWEVKESSLDGKEWRRAASGISIRKKTP